ncbi:hypothetical protein GCM10029992_32200 [Glycomyces albus]
METLPAAERDSLRVAFGLAGEAPEPFRVGLAALGLLAAAAADRPLLCLVDDAHWLDDASAKALAFLARRIAAEPVALLLASRETEAAPSLEELPTLAVGGLSEADARTVLAEAGAVAIDQRVRDRVLAEARGNPLALIELPKAGGFELPRPSPVAGRVERSFRTRVTALSADARLLLTLAGADPTGDPALLWTAAERMGIDIPAASAAVEASGLARFGTRTRFCHPLARSAAYRSAEPDQRRAAHRALAEATDPAAAPDRRAWHRAQATTGPDEDVATDLAMSASRARSRGASRPPPRSGSGRRRSRSIPASRSTARSRPRGRHWKPVIRARHRTCSPASTPRRSTPRIWRRSTCCGAGSRSSPAPRAGPSTS